MQREDFTKEMNTKITELVSDTKIHSDIISRGQQLIDGLEGTVDDDNEWDGEFADLYLGTIDRDYLFRGAEVINGVAVPESNPTDEELGEAIEMIKGQARLMPNAARVVMFEASRSIQNVLAANPA